MKWKITPKGLLIFTCCFYFVFSVLLLHPANISSRKLNTSTYGKLGRHILRPWRMAFQDSLKPFDEVKDHALFHKRSPGLFKFIAELTARLGAKSPIPLQFCMIFLVILGIIAQYTWLKEYFKNDIFPVVSCLFILGSHWLTHFGLTIHQHPYNFFFFNFCMLSIVRYANTKLSRYYLYAWMSYFFLCQNYYMFWISTFIMMVGILYFSGVKIISLKNFVLGLAPILTVIGVIIQLSIAHGSFDKSITTLKGAAKARIADDIQEGSGFKKKMTTNDWLKYPLTVSSRVERYFYIPGTLFLFLAWILLRLRKVNNSSLNYNFFYFLVPAGLSWYLLMFQHTSVHQVAGRYSYFLWMIFFGYFFYEINEYIKKFHPKEMMKMWIKYTWVFILIYGIYGFLYLNVGRIFLNIKQYVDYKMVESKALQGDIISRLDIKSNKFINGYHFYNDDWLKELSRSPLSINENATIVFQKFNNNIGYYVIKINNDFYTKKSLYLNNKAADLRVPNEYEHDWKYNQYIVLKLEGFGRATKAEFK